MKIIHFIESVKISYGGPAFGMSRIINNYPPNIDATVVVTGRKFVGSEVYFKKKVKLVILKNGLDLIKFLIKNHYDLAIVHGVWRYELFIVGIFSYFQRKKAFVFPHGMLDTFFFERQQKKWFKKVIFHRVFQKYALLLYSRILCTSAIEKNKIVSLQKSLVNSVCDVGYGINKSEIELDQKLADNYLGRYYVYMSRFHEKKGIKALIEAYSKLIAPKFELVLCGSENEYYNGVIKPLIQSCENKDRIHFMGQVTGERKWSVLEKAEYMLLPSFQENFGVIIAEALAVGTPVILGKDLDIADIIKKNKCGYTVSPSVKNLASLLQMIDDDYLTVPSSALCKSVFEEYFDMGKVTDQILKLAS